MSDPSPHMPRGNPDLDLESISAPDLSPEPHWKPVSEAGVYRPERSFIHSDPEGLRLRVRFYQDERPHFVGKVWFGPYAEGPPACAHGGSIAAILDDAMGRCAWEFGHKVLAGRLTFDYRRKTPLFQVHQIDAWIESVDTRKLLTRATLMDARGRTLTEGEGIFVRVSEEDFQEEKRRLEAMGYSFDAPRVGGDS